MSKKAKEEAQYYWGEISPDEAREFLKDAEKRGYRKAVARLGKKTPGIYEYVLSYLRADWIFDAINLKNTNKALDIGSGWGSIVFSLSKQFDEVTSLEAVGERLEFQKLRAKQDKIKNIKFVQSDWLELPFPDNSFDLVSCNGVLEWIGISDFKKAPDKLQLQFLKEVKRVLKTNGVVYIGIENRFAGFLFLGAKDHSGLPFTSLVPRDLADWITKNFRVTEGEYKEKMRMETEWPDYRTYTYSKSGYEKLLKKAGFKNTNIHWSIAYNSPSDAGPIDKQSFSYLLKLFKNHDFNATFLSKMATRLGSLLPVSVSKLIIQYFSPSFLIYSSNKKANSFSDQLIVKYGAESFLRRSGTHGLNSKINYFLLKDSKPMKIVKFARFKDYEKALQREEELLARWSGIKVDTDKLQDKKIYLEPFIEGRVAQTYDWDDNKNAISWLIHFQKSNKKGKWSKKSFDLLSDKILKTISDNSIFDKEVLNNTSNELKAISKNKSLFNLPKSHSHGDFVKTNIIFDKEERIFVIDWEFYQENFYPLFDFLFFLINNSMIGNYKESFRENWTGVGEYSEIIKKSVTFYSSEYSISKEFILENMIWVLSYALYRRLDDKYFRHLNLETYINLITIWQQISKESQNWIAEDEE